MTKSFLILFITVLAGCNGINRQVKKVDCAGIIHIQSVKKSEAVRLIKYDVINNQYYSPGKPFLGMMEWFDPAAFDEIRCSH